MNSLLEQAGGHQIVCQMVGEYFHSLGKPLSDFETLDHINQESRQIHFMKHALTAQPEPVHHGCARFLAQGLNPLLFEAVLEYIEGRLYELGHSEHFSTKLVKAVNLLFMSCDRASMGFVQPPDLTQALPNSVSEDRYPLADVKLPPAVEVITMRKA